jgi:hypothetical protein
MQKGRLVIPPGVTKRPKGKKGHELPEPAPALSMVSIADRGCSKSVSRALELSSPNLPPAGHQPLRIQDLASGIGTKTRSQAAGCRHRHPPPAFKSQNPVNPGVLLLEA